MGSAFENRDVRQDGAAADRPPLTALGAVDLDPRYDFARVYEACYPAVYRAVRGIVLQPDLAEDVTQDAFLKAYRARHRFRPTGRVEAWLCTIAVREAISRLRWTAVTPCTPWTGARSGTSTRIGSTAVMRTGPSMGSARGIVKAA